MNEEKPQVNFYNLDRTKPFSYVGEKSSSNLFIAFAVFFAVSTAMLLGFGFKWFFKDTETTLIPAVMIGATVVFSALSVWFHLRKKTKRRKQREVFENCTLTDGVVIGAHKYVVGSGDNERFEVELVYRFTDSNNVGHTASVSGAPDEFFVGQNIMVAFTENESFVMTEYTLAEEDRQKFIKTEKARSDDDFDDISNELLDIDLSKPVKSAEGNFVYKLLAIICAVMLALYSVPVGIFLLPQFFDGGPVIPNAIGCVMALLLPAVLISCIIALLYKYRKRQKRFYEILKANPYFTWGKSFYSEKTYNSNSKKQLLYCYIDKWDEKHTENFHGVFSNAMARPRSAVVIAYTADGRSVPVESFTFLHPEEYVYDGEKDDIDEE